MIPIEVRINKEVRDYQESVFFGLSLRQLIFALLAVLVAVGVYFGLRNIVGAMTGRIRPPCTLLSPPRPPMRWLISTASTTTSASRWPSCSLISIGKCGETCFKISTAAESLTAGLQTVYRGHKFALL